MMLRSATLFAITTAALLLAAGTTQAQDIYPSECRAEVERYCAEVKPGHGRRLACLYAHEDNLSDMCDARAAPWFDQLDWLAHTMEREQKICMPDFQKYCGDVVPGEGRAFICLHENRERVSVACNYVLDSASNRLGHPR